MLNNDRLDRLDRQAAAMLTDLSPETVADYDRFSDAWECADAPAVLGEFATLMPQLTAEIRRLWAELDRGNQAGMVSILAESREATCR